MLFIAHRGNIKGPSGAENSPSQIDFCLNQSFDCEIDLWVINGKFYLGHDSGQFPIDEQWLIERRQRLWIHCKNSEALSTLSNSKDKKLNFFWHQQDAYTLTSSGHIWVYPGQPIIPKSVSVLPENWISERRIKEVSHGFAICTDYVLRFKDQFVGSDL